MRNEELQMKPWSFPCLPTAVWLHLAIAPAMALVGVTDPCPVPTPYPPPGAGAAAINNASMEAGFTNGAANAWIPWKDSTYTNQTHQVGTEHVADGSYSQKLVLPQPPPDFHFQEAGLYQQIHVVPGGLYTVTAKFYLSLPGTTNGQNLLAYLGADPFGESNGDGGGMQWTEVSTQNQWRTLSVTVQAVFPVLTVSVKGTRKWPADGNGAQVWIDQLTISGPVPSGSPPGPEPDPIDPETLIPDAVGSNLVPNASFEDPFSNGVSAGWNKWAVSGTGTWKRSQRVGLIGGAQYDCGGTTELIEMKTKSVLLLGPDPETNPDAGATLGTSDVLKTHGHMEDAIIVGRPFIDSNIGYYYANPTYYGPRLAEQCLALQQRFPRIDCWQALNEPDWGPNWQNVVRFEYEFARRCHELGLKSCSLNLATGNPGNIWRMVDETFNPSAGDLLAIADYLGHHVYGGPADHFMVTNQNLHNPCLFALRPRQFKDMYARRGWRFPPVIATEGSTWVPWHGNYTPDRVTQDLLTMGDYMRADRFWAGYTNFVVGAQCSWPDFDIVGQYLANGKSMAQAIGEWNENHPADAMDGLYSQMFGAGKVHPKTTAELTPAGLFTGGINRTVTNLIPGREHLLVCWMKYEFRGHQPAQLQFHLGVDATGQTANGNAATIDWGDDQISDKAPVHEIFTHVWRTFTPTASAASIWLRARHPVSDPSFMVYVDKVEVNALPPPPGPTIELSTYQIDLAVAAGVDPSDGAFTVRNAGIGTLNYALTSDAAWLSVQPDSGVSTGEADAIAIHYATAGLGAGLHTANVTVASVDAVNSPRTLVVNLTVRTAKPDFDGDTDVDQEDFGRFQACYSGPGVIQTDPACARALLDEDDDVDQSDFALFRDCMSGANNPADPDCTN